MGLFGLWRHALGFREMRLLLGSLVVAAAGLAWWAPRPAAFLPAALCGALAWVPAEYLIHRFMLHMPRPRHPGLRRVHDRLHYQHHQCPDDKPWLLFVPLFSSLQLLGAAVAAGAAWGGAAGAGGALLGLSLTMCHYEITHLAAHVAYRPRTRWGRMLKRTHRLHHFKNERYWFGVTHPFMDYLFGTWPDHKAVDRSPTARDLEGEPGYPG